MEQDVKLALGKILGKVYKMQRNSSGFNGSVAERTVNGLLYGHEETIEREIGSLQMITNEEMNIVASILEPYVQDRSLLRSLKNYDDIDNEAMRRGLDLTKARRITILLGYEERYAEVMDKLRNEMIRSYR